MRVRCLGVGFLVTLLASASPALAANQTVIANEFNQFVPKHVTVDPGNMVTWNNMSGGGLHNVHFDDNSFQQPPFASNAAWSVSKTFPTPGLYGYYCDVHGGPNGVGMSGTVTVTGGPGYPRPRGATPIRVPLAPAYKACASPNRTHGPPLAFPSCNGPVQESATLTVGTPDANGVAANSSGSVTLTTIAGDPGIPGDQSDVQVVSTISDVRNKTGLTDYTGQVQVRLSLRITDRLNGPSTIETGTGDTVFNITSPCTATGDPASGSNCTITTTMDAVASGAVVEGKRAIMEVGKIDMYDGGSDGVVSTAPNTLFADQSIFIP